MSFQWIKEFEKRVRTNPIKSRKLDQIMGIIPYGMSGKDFYKEVEYVRGLARIRFWCGEAMALLGAVLLGTTELSIWLRVPFGLFFFLYGLNYIFVARMAMRNVYREYYRFRILPYQRQLKVEYPELVLYVPKFRLFRSTENLRDLEKSFLDGIRSDLPLIRRKREMQRWPEQNEKIRKSLLDKIQSARLPLETRNEVEQLVLKAWSKMSTNPAIRKRYAGKVERFLTREEHQVHATSLSHTSTVVVPSQEKDVEDYELTLLESQAEIVETPRARELYSHALKCSNRRERVRLLKKAIYADQAEEEIEVSTTISAQAEKSVGETRFLVLDEFMEQTFSIAHLVPKSLEADMVKEILLELLDPGTGSWQRRFQKAYRTETRLRRRVRQRYESWRQKPFEPRSYQRALDWMVQEGILRTKPKREPTYSLSANTLEARSEGARLIITAIIKLDRDVRAL